MAFDFDLDVTAENVIKNLNQMAHDPARDGAKFRLWASGKLGITVVESNSMKAAAAVPARAPAKKARKSLFGGEKRAGKTSDPKKSDG